MDEEFFQGKGILDKFKETKKHWNHLEIVLSIIDQSLSTWLVPRTIFQLCPINLLVDHKNMLHIYI